MVFDPYNQRIFILSPAYPVGFGTGCSKLSSLFATSVWELTIMNKNCTITLHHLVVTFKQYDMTEGNG